MNRTVLPTTTINVADVGCDLQSSELPSSLPELLVPAWFLASHRLPQRDHGDGSDDDDATSVESHQFPFCTSARRTSKLRRMELDECGVDTKNYNKYRIMYFYFASEHRSASAAIPPEL